MNKKTILTLLIVVFVLILLSVILIGALGFFRAHKIKQEAKKLQDITYSTLNLNPIAESQFELNISEWEKYAQGAPSVKNEIGGINYLSVSLKENLNNFYSDQAQNRVKEVKYLQFLIDGQRYVGLTEDLSKKSKGQIESVLDELDKMQNNLNQNNLSLGPEFSSYIDKIETEQINFKNYLLEEHDKMNYESPAVEIKTTTLNNAVENLKKAIIKSLNNWIGLQDEIKNQILEMGKINWVNPFIK